MTEKMSAANEDQLRFITCLQSQLQSLQLCSSDEEAYATAEALADQYPFEKTHAYLDMVAESFRDYFVDLSDSNISDAVRAADVEAWGVHSSIAAYVDAVENDSNDSSVCSEDDEASAQTDSDGDGELLREGECELCERTIKLTRHHLIPKSTWPRMKKRLWNAASEIESFHAETDLEKQGHLRQKLQKSGFNDPAHLPSTISHASIRSYLMQVSTICRPCHSAVHRIHDEWELATEYYTIERLLQCNEVRKFAKWNSKQRPGKYSVK